jgi:ComEC/Rec2-related protein
MAEGWERAGVEGSVGLAREKQAPLAWIALVAWAGLHGAVAEWGAPWVWCVVLALAAPVAWWGRGRLRVAGVLTMTAAAFAFYGGVRLHSHPPDHVGTVLRGESRGARLRVEVMEDPVRRIAGNKAEAAEGEGDVLVGRVEFRGQLRGWQAGEWQRLSGRVMVRLLGNVPEVAYGDTLEMAGFLHPPVPSTNPGQFDHAAWLHSQGITHVLQASGDSVTVVERGGGWRLVRWAIHFRHHMQRTLQLGQADGDEASALMSGMLFGFRDGISEPLQHAFRVTGTMHLFAVSGQNVGIILAVLMLVLQMAGVIRWRWAWTLLPMVLVFCLSTGMQPSAFRAFVMAALLALGWALYRPVGLFNILGAAALLMWVWDPAMVLDLGFQLSFCVVAGIGWLAGPVVEWLKPWGAPDPWIPQRLVPWWRRRMFQGWKAVAGLTAVSLAAWVAALPLTLWHFHLFSPVSLLANVLIVPMATVVLVVSALSVTLGALWVNLAVAANGISGWVLQGVMAVVLHLASWPGGYVYVAHPGSGPVEGTVRLTVLHHRQSSPAVVQAGSKAWLIDPGPVAAWRFVVDPFRMTQGINRWEGVVLSHGGTRRLGSAVEVLQTTPAGWWADAGWRSRSRAQHAWLDAMETADQGKRMWRAGEQVFWHGNLEVDVLHPGAEVPGDRLEDRGLVWRLNVPGGPVLWAGDISGAVEGVLAATDVRARVLVQGEHPASPNLTTGWLEAVRPEILIRPGRGYQPDRSLTPEFWQQASRLGIRVLRLDRTGAVTLDFHPAGMEVRPFRVEGQN